MASLKHMHSYIYYKRTKSGQVYYKCNDPHCTAHAERSLLINKASLCSKCRRGEVILTSKVLHDNKKPLCINCSNSRAGRQYRASKALMEDILGSIQQEDVKKAS